MSSWLREEPKEAKMCRELSALSLGKFWVGCLAVIRNLRFTEISDMFVPNAPISNYDAGLAEIVIAV